MDPALRGYYRFLAPRPTGLSRVQNVVTGASGVSTALFTGLGDDEPHGRVWVMIEATGNDVFVQFRQNSTSAVTKNTGAMIPKDSPGRVFWLNVLKDIYVDHISPDGAGVLKWWVCSPPFEVNG